jgi:hypothetical protein
MFSEELKNQGWMPDFDKAGQLNLLIASHTLDDVSLLSCLELDNKMPASHSDRSM